MSSRNRLSGVTRRAVALLSVWTLLVGALAFGVGAEQPQKAQRLSEEQRILHVLNRLGFGARPGDVERVRAIGLERYIEQQLFPEKITDAVADAKVKNLPALHAAICLLNFHIRAGPLYFVAASRATCRCNFGSINISSSLAL